VLLEGTVYCVTGGHCVLCYWGALCTVLLGGTVYCYWGALCTVSLVGTLPVAQLVEALRYKPEGRGFDS